MYIWVVNLLPTLIGVIHLVKARRPSVSDPKLAIAISPNHPLISYAYGPVSASAPISLSQSPNLI